MRHAYHWTDFEHFAAIRVVLLVCKPASMAKDNRLCGIDGLSCIICCSRSSNRRSLHLNSLQFMSVRMNAYFKLLVNLAMIQHSLMLYIDITQHSLMLCTGGCRQQAPHECCVRR